MMPSSGKAGAHAVVIGGSMAGMLAARVLADHFERVTIVERDQVPSTSEFRAGVPQGRHVHIFLARGQQVLEELFPGIRAKIIDAGALLIDLINDMSYYGATGSTPRFPSQLHVFVSSRPFLEWMVRRELLEAYPSVAWRAGYEATGLVGARGETVTGLRLRQRGAGNEGTAEILVADLVVDASGRESHAPEWLAALGYAAPEETKVDAHLGYASRVYRRPETGADWKAMLIPEQAPDNLRGGVIWPVEDNQWIVTLGGAGGDYPPTDDAGFLEFARSMPHPALYEAIKDAAPLSPIYGFRRTANRLRHFERLTRLPDGFIVAGDAVCAFNPVYGQGMTTAALGAVTLQCCLRRQGDSLAGMPLRFQRALAKVNDTAWLLATGSDFRVPNVEASQPPRATRLTHRYLDGVLQLITQDRETYLAFIEVAHLLRPPATLFRPTIAAKVAWHLARQRSPVAVVAAPVVQKA